MPKMQRYLKGVNDCLKIKLVYSLEEQSEVDVDLALLRLRHPGSKVHSGTDRPDQRQVYLKGITESQQLTPCNLCGFYPPRQDKPCSFCPAEVACTISG